MQPFYRLWASNCNGVLQRFRWQGGNVARSESLAGNLGIFNDAEDYSGRTADSHGDKIALKAG